MIGAALARQDKSILRRRDSGDVNAEVRALLPAAELAGYNFIAILVLPAAARRFLLSSSGSAGGKFARSEQLGFRAPNPPSGR